MILVVKSGGVPVVRSACKGGLIFNESVVLDPCIVCGGVVGGSVDSVVGVVGLGVVVVSGANQEHLIGGSSVAVSFKFLPGLAKVVDV